MFFQIEDICAQHSDDAIRRVIGSLPRDLPATYQRALERVVRNHKAEVARKMFRWVAAAKRPLSLMEIREAIAVEPRQPFSQQAKLVNDVYQLVPWCGNLLALDEEEGLVQFAHHSVKDYLLSGKVSETSSHPFRIKLQDVEQEVGEICCTYLNFSDFKREIIHFPQAPSGLDPNTIVETSLSASSSPRMTSSLLRLNNLRKARRATEASAIWRQLQLTSLRVATMWPQNLQTRYKFLAYASEYWLHHTSNFNQENLCWGLFRRLVLAEETDLGAKPWSMEEWKAFGAKVQNFILKTEHHALLSVVILEQPTHARADLCRMVEKHSVLCSDEILQFLVNTTGSVEGFWSTWDSVLIIAAERRRLDLVKQVLKLAGGFDSVLAQNRAKEFNSAPAHMDGSLAKRWDSAWQRAERQGTYEMLDLLLTYKAIMLGKIKERGYEELYLAALAGNLEMTGRLLDARVDPNVVPLTQPPLFDSILAAAASGGSLAVVERLLYAGAEVNLQKVGLRKTALVAAAEQGHTLVVIALLAAGADVNACSGIGFHRLRPMEAAADHGDVRILLEGALGTDPKLGPYVRVDSSFPPRDREFFGALKDYVKNRCGKNLGPSEVKEAVDSFLQRTLQPEKELRRKSIKLPGSQGDAASEEEPGKESEMRVT